ncbi:MAG: AAA family ATPase [Kiritimatiellae bacterium]|nr:AAA family ATPase [Kiritimatiellia bacterium]
MRLSRIQIKNFRNFKNLDVAVSEHAVIVGENKIGKSNLVYALRLLLDPTLPDSARQLREEDFWDGLKRPLSSDNEVRIALDITDFEDNPKLLAVLAEHLVAVEPMIARLTYVFRPLQTLEGPPVKDSDFEFFIFGGESEENIVSYELRRRLPMDVFPALRDAESDLANWRRSPLRPLLEKAAGAVDKAALEEIAQRVSDASDEITAVPEIAALNTALTDRLTAMVGCSHAVNVTLGLTPSDSDRLIRALRLFIDSGKRGISEASLGSANLIYLALKALELRQLVEEGNRDHTFLAIEEPEAHLHPHLQRLVYRDFLHSRQQSAVEQSTEEGVEIETNRTTFLTTHSPHIVSVTPLRSLVLLRKAKDGLSTEASSTAEIELADKDVADLERYLDVTRGEIVFSRAVLLVEGDAECFVVPTLAKLIGHDLDELGISVCSVSGTNFAPYIKLLGTKGLGIPFAVITDYDPTDGGGSLGVDRVAALLELIIEKTLKFENKGDFLKVAAENGLFLNEYTFEVDFFRCGRHKSLCNTLIELTKNGAAEKRAKDWMEEPSSLNPEQMLKDVEAIAKGRFAQRLATHLRGTLCPKYIQDAVSFLAEK